MIPLGSWRARAGNSRYNASQGIHRPCLLDMKESMERIFTEISYCNTQYSEKLLVFFIIYPDNWTTFDSIRFDTTEEGIQT